MRFIHAWSYACANYLMSQLKESHEKRRVYYYGFQIVIGSIVKGVLLVVASLLIGSLVPTLIALMVFAILRLSAGGYHMNTYGKCIITSLGLFLISGAIVQYTYKSWDVLHVAVFTAVAFITAMAVIIKYAPSDTPNRPITKPEEIKKFRRLSVITLIIWLAAAVVLILSGVDRYEMYVAAGCFGLLLETFTISPAGYRFFDKISGEVDVIKAKPKHLNT